LAGDINEHGVITARIVDEPVNRHTARPSSCP
jgi:hypothetical protein